jgi:hypothetical protein
MVNRIGNKRMSLTFCEISGFGRKLAIGVNEFPPPVLDFTLLNVS